MSNNPLLEVDESIVTKNLLLPGTKEEEEFGELLKSFNRTERPSKTIRPIPGSCVKAKTESGEKVFLNICQTTEIPAPESISDAKLLEILQDETPSNYRIPMSIGLERQESDKSGAPSLTYDIAINTKFFEKCKENNLFWAFMITVAIEGVSNKYDKRINPEGYIVLKNRKVMGKLQDHRIEMREVNKAMCKPLIEELGGNKIGSSNLETETVIAAGDASSTGACVSDIRNARKTEYRILREPKEGNVERLVGQFKLNDLLSSKDLAVDVGEDRIVVEARRTGYLIDIFVPYCIIQERVSAVLDKNIGMLTLNMPVVH